MAFTKQPAFTTKTTDLPDVPSPTYTPAQIKSYIQNPSNELMTNFNNAIDKLNSTTDGDSGADNIGATGFDGTPSNPQAMLEYLNTRKADKGADWTGTWQGFIPSQVDQTIRDQVNTNTAQLAENIHHQTQYNRNRLIREINTMGSVLGIQGAENDLDKIPFTSYVRLICFWSFIEQQDGSYVYNNPSYNFDQYVQNAIDKNKRIIICFEVGTTPPSWFTTKYPTSDNKFIGDNGTALNGYLNFVDDVTKRYSNMGIVWEMYNEPNKTADTWSMITGFSGKVRTNDYTSFVIAPSYDSINADNLLTGTGNTIDSLLSQGMMDYVDGISMHNYKGSIPEAEDNQSNYLGLTEVLNKHGFSRVPVYITEWGYSLYNTFDGANMTLTETDKANYLIRAYLHGLRYGIGVHIWHQLRSGQNAGTEPTGTIQYQEDNFGLMDYNYNKLPAYYAIQGLSMMIGNAKFIKQIKTNSDYARLFLFRTLNNQLVLVYFTNVTTETIKLSIPTTIGTQYVTNVSISYVDGTLTQSQQDTQADNAVSLSVTNQPQYLLIGETDIDEITCIYDLQLATNWTGSGLARIKNDGTVFLEGEVIYSPSGTETDIPQNTIICELPIKLIPKMGYYKGICLSVDVPNVTDKWCRVDIDNSNNVLKVVSLTNGSRVSLTNISYALY